MKWLSFPLLLVCALMIGCQNKATDSSSAPTGDPELQTPAKTNDAGMPVFSLATSEYPSWSTYMVAAKLDLINGEEGGKMGSLEEKYGVDVVLKVADYDPCLTYFANGVVDAVCMTNMDSPLASRKPLLA